MWRQAVLTVNDLKCLKTLEAENRRLRQLVAEKALDNQALKELRILTTTCERP